MWTAGIYSSEKSHFRVCVCVCACNTYCGNYTCEKRPVTRDAHMQFRNVNVNPKHFPLEIHLCSNPVCLFVFFLVLSCADNALNPLPHSHMALFIWASRLSHLSHCPLLPSPFFCSFLSLFPPFPHSGEVPLVFTIHRVPRQLHSDRLQMDNFSIKVAI